MENESEYEVNGIVLDCILTLLYGDTKWRTKVNTR
jgi:hypothetical protein